MVQTSQAAQKTIPARYPFSALVGQVMMKRALILLAIDPGLGGVLLRGEKGTAKSTAARALASLLPAPPGGPGPTPFVDLPLGATEDRLIGSLDLTAAVQGGRVVFSPGLVTQADGGLLYIDEVNLLPPHLVQMLLDACVSGRIRVEREGISHLAPARFSLVASCNPEEGPIGPQLLDRFGLCVEVASEMDPALRRELILRRLAFESDPAGFRQKWEAEEQHLARGIAQARDRLPRVILPEAVLQQAVRAAASAGAAGQRGELALVRAVRALAAWRHMDEAAPDLVDLTAPLALDHRARIDQAADVVPEVRTLNGAPGADGGKKKAVRDGNPAKSAAPENGRSAGAEEQVMRIMTPGAVKPIATRAPARETGSAKQAGRRASRKVSGNRGRYLRASAQRLGRSLAFDATFRAAAPHQKKRRHPGGPALVVLKQDIREKVRAARRGRLLLFCVDASGSMNAAARMRETKAAVLGLLTEAYQKRDRVGLIAFGGLAGRELLPPTSSVEVARRMLAEMPTGGKTPLAAGLHATAEVLARELAKDPKLNPLVVILTDGRPNIPLAASLGDEVDLLVAGNKGGGWGDGWGDGGYADREVLNLAQRLAADPRPRYVVVDTDTGHHHEINLCRPLADYLGAPCVPLGRLSASQVLDLVKKHW